MYPTLKEIYANLEENKIYTPNTDKEVEMFLLGFMALKKSPDIIDYAIKAAATEDIIFTPKQAIGNITFGLVRLIVRTILVASDKDKAVADGLIKAIKLFRDGSPLAI